MGAVRMKAKVLLERIASWPEDDVIELEQAAREIEEWRAGAYVMTDDEAAAVREGVEQIVRGELASEEDMTAFWKRVGAL